jgi:uncharacterized sulfatase
MRSLISFACLWTLSTIIPIGLNIASAKSPPNILFCISDDQSYAHTGANGDPVIKTPAFDRIAREGIRFTHAFCDAPTCGPSRSAILTGQPIWRLEEAGNIHSTLPAKFATYTQILEDAGYAIGSTSKAWGPGRLKPGGRTVNPAGVSFKNFADFLTKTGKDRPFCFWLGSRDPHRPYKLGSGVQSGKDPQRVIVPPYFPDHPVVRGDILDYYVEVERFDRAVANALGLLEKSGQLDNTIVVVTSDHGMPFPRAKASLYDAGTRVPLAIRWPSGIASPGRVFEGFVNLSDMAPTFLEAAGLKPPAMMTAHSLKRVFTSTETNPRNGAFIAMERHDGCRKGGKGYPCRAIRTADFLYILNHQPNRWPAGDPDASVCARNIPFGEVDGSPTKQLLMDNVDRAGFHRFYELAFAKRPGEELYDLKNDPGQLRNLATRPDFAETRKRLRNAIQRHLTKTKDPRALGLDAPWDYYPYYGLRRNKDWKVDAKP